MLEIYIDNTPLDLPDAFELESEESNPLFAFDSLTEGSFCYTVNIPYSPKNARLANWPQRLEASANHIMRKNCEIRDNHRNIDQGLALFSKSTRSSLDLSIGTGESAFVNLAKNINIKDGNYPNMTFNKYNHTDYVTYPHSAFSLACVANPEALTGYSANNLIIIDYSNDNRGFQNGFQDGYGTLRKYISPFMFFFYILDFLAKKMGYYINFNIAQDDERLSAAIYTPNVMYASTENKFNPANFLPDISLLDLIVAFKQSTFLQFFIDESSHEITIDDVSNIKKWKIEDITEMVELDYEESHSDIIRNVKVGRRIDETDDEQKKVIDTYSLNFTGVIQSAINLPPASTAQVEEVKYVINDGVFYKNTFVEVGNQVQQQWVRCGANEAEHLLNIVDLTGDDFNVDLSATIWTERKTINTYPDNVFDGFIMCPVTFQKGELINYSEDKRDKTKFEPRFLLSRGMFLQSLDDDNVPQYAPFRFASNSIFNIYQNLDGTPGSNFKESLLFSDWVIEDGVAVDRGLYESKIKILLNYTVNKRIFTFYLNIKNKQQRQKLKFTNLVSVNGTKFLIKKRKLRRSHSGFIKGSYIECVPFTA